MQPSPIHRLPPPLEAAVQRLRMAARDAAERSIESLGLAALSATQAFQRDGFLGAQFELNRKSAIFILSFNDSFHDRVMRELSPASSGETPSQFGRQTASAAPSGWDALSLVDDREVEARITAERFGMEIAHGCEWELRELDAYVTTLLDQAGGERGRNPLRPELLGHALLHAIDSVTERSDVRKLLSSELGRSLSALLPAAYAAIVADFRNAGVQPASLSVRQRGAAARDSTSPADTSLGGAAVNPGDSQRARGPSGASAHGGFAASSRGAAGQASANGHGHAHGSTYGSARSGTSLGQVDPNLMSLIRRLAFSGTGGHSAHDLGPGDGMDSGASPMGGASAAALPNLIHAHRDELRQASRGSLDHMVIDVIGFLFDQILSDGKVPPQMARQLARLQLPVLRAALGDPTFFSSRRHPVRRFVNRIASLGAAFEDFNEDIAKNVLAKVSDLVHEVVEGDFDQIEIYQQKLAALEAYVAEQAAQDLSAQGNAAELLSEKEDELRLRQLYAERLAGELKDVAAPPFVHEFVSKVWSQALLRAGATGGPEGALALRLRRAGRELMLSVQPKTTPAHRKSFLAELPKLMQDLTEGMNLIAWPDAQRRAFFAQLMPAHAEALKSPAARPLDLNLMARKVEGVLDKPVPSREEVKAALHLPVLSDELMLPALSDAEAQSVGLLKESAIDWDGKVDIDLSAQDDEAPAQAQPAAPGLPALSDAPEPTRGVGLAEHVQIGFAYQMHINEQWQKVRLSHVSPGRSFFIFTMGSRHKKTVTLTMRMLTRLCETGRLRAFESSTLIERATERARRQLAALGAGSAARAPHS